MAEQISREEMAKHRLTHEEWEEFLEEQIARQERRKQMADKGIDYSFIEE